MSISLQHTPQDYDFCDNPLAFSLQSNSYLLTSGVKARQRIQMTGVTQDSDTIYLAFLDYEFTFTFKTAPDSSGFQLTAGSTIYTLATELNKNYYLHKYYDISVSGTDKVELLAKENGGDYTIVISVSSAALDDCDAIAGVSDTYNQNFKLFVKLFVETDFGSEIFYEQAEAFLDTNTAGSADFYFGKILKRLYTIFEPPNFGITSLHGVYSPVLNYYIEYAEYYGEDPLMRLLSTSDQYHCINGKLKQDKWKNHDFFDDIKTSKLLLTNKPLKSYMWREAHGYVYYLNTQGKTEDFTVTYTPLNKDGSADPPTTKNITGLLAGRVLGIPIGADLLSLSLANKDLLKFTIEVKITSSGTPVSEIYSFYIINRPFNPVNILYQNEYGVLDTLLCENLQVKLKTEKITSEKFQIFNYTLLQGHISNHIKKSEITFRASTGFIMADQAYHLIELLESGYAFMAGKTSYLKIDIIAGSFTLVKKSGDLQQFEFSFRLASSGSISTEELNI